MSKRDPIVVKSIMIGILVIIFLFFQFPVKRTNKLPVIGSIVHIINTKFFFQSGNNEIDANIPSIQYQGEIYDALNNEISHFIYKIIENFFAEYNEANHHYTKIDYEVITNNYLWLTLKINVLKTMADSYNYFKYYHINKKTNKIISLKDLFKNEDYKKIITNSLKKEMQQRMREDKNLIYWIDKVNPDYNINLIADDQNFYFNKKGELIIVFNENEISPGYMGVQEFIINLATYKDYLK